MLQDLVRMLNSKSILILLIGVISCGKAEKNKLYQL